MNQKPWGQCPGICVLKHISGSSDVHCCLKNHWAGGSTHFQLGQGFINFQVRGRRIRRNACLEKGEECDVRRQKSLFLRDVKLWSEFWKVSLWCFIAMCSLKRERFDLKNTYITKCFELPDKYICSEKLVLWKWLSLFLWESVSKVMEDRNWITLISPKESSLVSIEFKAKLSSRKCLEQIGKYKIYLSCSAFWRSCRNIVTNHKHKAFQSSLN